jgi:hypothetical protein
MPSLDYSESAIKEHKARVGEVFDRTRTGITVGAWRGRQVDAVEHLGSLQVLHGTVCTCCERRSA